MDSAKTPNAKVEICGILQEINDAWINGQPEKLEQYFHENMVIVSPTFEKLGNGKVACVQSYVDYVRRAKTYEYKESDHQIDIYGNTAIATYKFEIKYEIAGKISHEFGHDLFVFNRENGRWLAVWRAVFPQSE